MYFKIYIQAQLHKRKIKKEKSSLKSMNWLTFFHLFLLIECWSYKRFLEEPNKVDEPQERQQEETT